MDLAQLYNKAARKAVYGIADAVGLGDIKRYSESKPAEMGINKNSEHNGMYDAARHILASAELTRKYGPTLADMFTTGYEKALWFGEPNEAAYNMDIHNNQLGRELAQKYKTREEIEQAMMDMLQDAHYTRRGIQGKEGMGVQGVPRWLREEEMNYDY